MCRNVLSSTSKEQTDGFIDVKSPIWVNKLSSMCRQRPDTPPTAAKKNLLIQFIQFKSDNQWNIKRQMYPKTGFVCIINSTVEMYKCSKKCLKISSKLWKNTPLTSTKAKFLSFVAAPSSFLTSWEACKGLAFLTGWNLWQRRAWKPPLPDRQLQPRWSKSGHVCLAPEMRFTFIWTKFSGFKGPKSVDMNTAVIRSPDLSVVLMLWLVGLK